MVIQSRTNYVTYISHTYIHPFCGKILTTNFCTCMHYGCIIIIINSPKKGRYGRAQIEGTQNIPCLEFLKTVYCKTGMFSRGKFGGELGEMSVIRQTKTIQISAYN